MSSISRATIADPEISAAITRAERRRGKLERLSDIGMDLAEQVGAHAAAAMAAVNEKHGGDPGRAFAAVSRAVRLTLALETRLDEEILALRNGDLPSLGRRRPATSISTPMESETSASLAASSRRVRDAVRDALRREVETPDAAQRVLERLDAGLWSEEAEFAPNPPPSRGDDGGGGPRRGGGGGCSAETVDEESRSPSQLNARQPPPPPPFGGPPPPSSSGQGRIKTAMTHPLLSR